MSLHKENPAVRPFPPFCLPTSILLPPIGSGGEFYNQIPQNWNEESPILTVAGYFGEPPYNCVHLLQHTIFKVIHHSSVTQQYGKTSQRWHSASLPPTCRGAESLPAKWSSNNNFSNLVLHVNSKGTQQFSAPLRPLEQLPFLLSSPTPLPFLPPDLVLWESHQQLHPWAPLGLDHQSFSIWPETEAKVPTRTPVLPGAEVQETSSKPQDPKKPSHGKLMGPKRLAAYSQLFSAGSKFDLDRLRDNPPIWGSQEVHVNTVACRKRGLASAIQQTSCHNRLQQVGSAGGVHRDRYSSSQFTLSRNSLGILLLHPVILGWLGTEGWDKYD